MQVKIMHLISKYNDNIELNNIQEVICVKIMIIAVILLLNISLCLNVFGIKVEEKFDFESDRRDYYA